MRQRALFYAVGDSIMVVAVDAGIEGSADLWVKILDFGLPRAHRAGRGSNPGAGPDYAVPRSSTTRPAPLRSSIHSWASAMDSALA